MRERLPDRTVPPSDWWYDVGYYKEALSKLPSDLQKPVQFVEYLFLKDSSHYSESTIIIDVGSGCDKFYPLFIPTDSLPWLPQTVVEWGKHTPAPAVDRSITTMGINSHSEDVYLLKSHGRIICTLPYMPQSANFRIAQIPFSLTGPNSRMCALTFATALSREIQKGLPKIQSKDDEESKEAKQLAQRLKIPLNGTTKTVLPSRL